MWRARLIAASIGLAAPSAIVHAAAQNAQEPVRGLVRAIDDALISTELNARIVQVARREGEASRRPMC